MQTIEAIYTKIIKNEYHHIFLKCNNSEVIILESRIKIVENHVGACIARPCYIGIASLALQRNACSNKLRGIDANNRGDIYKDY